MKHIDEKKCHNLDKSSTQMMESMLDLTKTSYEWSNCSVVELNDFLRLDIVLECMKYNSNWKYVFSRSGDAQCIFNIPDKTPNQISHFSDETKHKAIYPGDLQMYEIKYQCKHIFGPESDSCEQNLVNEKKHVLNFNHYLF